MSKIIETKINRWDGGIVNDPRDPRENTARVVTNFDVITNPRKMTPFRQSESGDNNGSTSRKQNYCIGYQTSGTDRWQLFALGVQSASITRAEILMKDLTTGGSDDLDDNTWASPAGNQSSQNNTSFNMFVFYKKTGKIYGGAGGRYIWAFTPDGSTAWDDASADLTSYDNLSQGLVASDDILYVGVDNKVYYKNGAGAWTLGLTLPSHLYVTSLTEFGNYLAIATAPLSGLGNSSVFLWDRNATLWSEQIDWGEGVLKVLETIQGILVGISLSGNSTTRFKNRIIFRYYQGGTETTQFAESLSSTDGLTALALAKQRIDNRLYFMMQAYINGAQRDGVWSVGRNTLGQFTIVHERTPNNDTALSSGQLFGFIFVGDYLFQSYLSSATYAVSKTDDQPNYPTAIHESKRYDGSQTDREVTSADKKDLVGVTLMTEYLPASGQVVVKYRKDNETSFTTIMTEATDNSISHSAVNIESSGATLPKDYKEIEFRLESSGGAEITAFSWKEEVTGKKLYD